MLLAIDIAEIAQSLSELPPERLQVADQKDAY